MKYSLTLFVVAIASWSAMAAPDRKPGPDVLVVSDVFGQEPTAGRPVPNHPVYYIMLGGKEHVVGEAVAGEPMPNRSAVAQEVVAALAQQGYVLTRLGGPKPSLVVLFAYGTANAVIDQITDPEGGPDTAVFYNRREIAQLVGADRASRHLMMTTEADRINSAASDDRLYVFVAALDADALTRKKKQLVWRARISIEARRHSLAESLKVMLASGAPYFGRETELPVFLDDADRRKPEVTVGTPKVVEPDVALPPPPGSSKK